MRMFTLLRYWVVLSVLVVLPSGCDRSGDGAGGASGDNPEVAEDTSADPLKQLLADLESDDNAKQAAAAARLAAMGPAAAPAIDALVRQLDDDDSHVRAHAARALGKIGEAAKSSAEALALAFRDKDQAVQREAIEAMALVKPGKEKVIPLMITALSNTQGGALVAAINTLANRGEAIVPAMTEALGNEKTVFWALLVLHEIGPDSKAAAPEVGKLLSHDHGEVRHEAAMVLRAMGPGAAPAVPELIASLQSKDMDLQVAAAMALGSIGPDAQASIDGLKGVAESEDDLTRVVVAWAMQKVDPNADRLRDEAVPLLMEQLKSTDRHVRQVAALALLDLKPSEVIGADKVVAAFSGAMKGASPEAQEDMLSAIATAGPKAVPALIKALGHPEIRRSAAEILAKIGPDAAEAVPALIEAAKDPDRKTCSECLFALARIGSAAKEAAPTAIACLNKEGEDEEVCISAIYLLGKIGPDASGAVETLKKGLDGADERKARVCAWALMMISPEDQTTVDKAVPILAEGLTSDKAFVVAEIATTLGALGPKAKDALPALKTALENASDSGLRETIQTAIDEIEKS